MSYLVDNVSINALHIDAKITKIILPILNKDDLIENNNPDLKKVREVIYQMGLEDETITQKIKVFKVQLPNASDIWGFLVSFGIDGLLIISLSKIIPAPAKGENLLLFASYYIAVRKIITIVLSPLIGWIMDKISLIHSVYLCCLCIILGFLHLAWWDINIGLTLTFIGSSINHTLIPLITVKNSTEKQQFNNLTKMSTSRDLGSAFGALFGLAIVQFIAPNYVFVALAIAINIPIIWIIQSANLKNTAILQLKN